jgi:hypothetical protein
MAARSAASEAPRFSVKAGNHHAAPESVTLQPADLIAFSLVICVTRPDTVLNKTTPSPMNLVMVVCAALAVSIVRSARWSVHQHELPPRLVMP